MSEEFELIQMKRVDRGLGGVLALALFLIQTGQTPEMLWTSTAALAVVWVATILLRSSDRPARKYDGRPSFYRRIYDSLNFRYALARIAELAAVLVAALALAVARERLPARIPPFDARLIVTLVLSLMAVGFLAAFGVSVSRGDPIEVRSQWGGLGNSAGGWRISRPMVCLLAAAVFGGLTALTNLSITYMDAPKLAASAATKAAPEEAAKENAAVSAPEQKSTAPTANATPAKK